LSTRGPVARIIAVGWELLTPGRVDTNSLFLTGELNRIGFSVEFKAVVGDRADLIARALQEAVETAQVVFLTGGLGPTADDITREVTAELFGHPLVFDRTIMDSIEERASRFRFPIGENNRRQAMVPEGGTVLANERGTAPGLLLREKEALVFLLPGPPRELQPMVREQVLPVLERTFPVSRHLTRHLSVASMAESKVDALVEPVYSRYPEVQTTILSSPGIIHLHLKTPESPRAKERLDELIAGIREQLKDALFTERGESLASVVGQSLQRSGLKLATAESCTGGLVAKMLTDVAGSSDYFKGSVVAYSNELKIRLLGVPRPLLEQEGAVSAAVAEKMAEGACRVTGASAALSVTGIAGPGGGSAEKPVGLVFFGLSCRGRLQCKRRLLPGDRETIRFRAAQFALDWLRRELL
jgi:nicotinamide-nucleotide amidase